MITLKEYIEKYIKDKKISGDWGWGFAVPDHFVNTSDPKNLQIVDKKGGFIGTPDSVGYDVDGFCVISKGGLTMMSGFDYRKDIQLVINREVYFNYSWMSEYNKIGCGWSIMICEDVQTPPIITINLSDIKKIRIKINNNIIINDNMEDLDKIVDILDHIHYN